MASQECPAGAVLTYELTTTDAEGNPVTPDTVTFATRFESGAPTYYAANLVSSPVTGTYAFILNTAGIVGAGIDGWLYGQWIVRDPVYQIVPPVEPVFVRSQRFQIVFPPTPPHFTRFVMESVSIIDSVATATNGGARDVSELLTLADLAQSFVRGRVAEAIVLHDVVTQRLASFRRVTDAASISDSAGLRFAIHETVGLSDAVRLLLRVTESLPLSDIARPLFKVTESISLHDSAARQIALTRRPIDTAPLSDSTRPATHDLQNVTESLSLADSLARRLTYRITESLSLADTPNRTLALPRPLADGARSGDTLARVGVYQRSATEPVSVSDSTGRTEMLTRTRTESVALVDSASRALALPRPLTDGTLAGDVLAHMGAFERSATESVPLSDSVKVLFKVSESVSVSDVVGPISTTRHFTESASIVDSVSYDLNTSTGETRNVSETVSLSDRAQRTARLARVLSDGMLATESLARLLVLAETLSDGALVSESLVRTLALTPRTLADGTLAGESLARTVHLTRGTLTDGAAAGDALARGALVLPRPLGDGAAAADSLARMLTLGPRTLPDGAVAVDSLARAAHLPRALSDGATAAETLVRSALTFARAIVGGAVASDSLARSALAFVRSLADGGLCGDSLARKGTLPRTLYGSFVVPVVTERASFPVWSTGGGTVTVPGTLAIGDLVVVAYFSTVASSGTYSTPSGAGVTSWTLVESETDGGGVSKVAAWVGAVTTAGVTSVTINTSLSAPIRSVVDAFTAAGASWTEPSAGGTTNTGTTIAMPSLTPSTSGELYWSGAYAGGGLGGSTVTPGGTAAPTSSSGAYGDDAYASSAYAGPGELGGASTSAPSGAYGSDTYGSGPYGASGLSEASPGGGGGTPGFTYSQDSGDLALVAERLGLTNGIAYAPTATVTTSNPWAAIGFLVNPGSVLTSGDGMLASDSLSVTALTRHFSESVPLSDMTNQNGGGGSGLLNVNNQTGTTYTMALTDNIGIVTMNNAGDNTVTVPPNSSVAFPIGSFFYVFQRGAGQTLVAPGSGVTFDTSSLTDVILAEGDIVMLIQLTVNEWTLTGDLGA